MRTLPSRLVSLLLPLALAALPAAAAIVPADGKDTDPAAEAPFKPKAYDLTRYSRNFEKKSPFEFDPPPPEPPVTDDYFKDISLGGYCGNAKTMSVYLLAGKEKKRITVYGDGSPFKKRDVSGFRILSINRGKSLTTTTVLLEKNGQQKAVGFAKDTLTAKGGGAPGGGKGQPVKILIGQDGRPLPQSGETRAGYGGGIPGPPYQAPPPFIPGQSNTQAANNQNVQNLQAQQQQQELQLRQAEAAAVLKARMQEHNGSGGVVQPEMRHRRVVLPTEGK